MATRLSLGKPVLYYNTHLALWESGGGWTKRTRTTISGITDCLEEAMGSDTTNSEFDINNLVLSGVDERQAAILRPFTDSIGNHFDKSGVELPDRMYHYTIFSTARSILENREFWLFSIFDPATESDKGAGAIDRQEVRAGIDIICDQVKSSFLKRDLTAFSVFAEKFETTLKTRFREIATGHILCVAAAPNVNLWHHARKQGDPACIVIPRALFEEWCERKEDRTGTSSSGQFYPFVVCYEADELRRRVRPFCAAACDVLDCAVKDANGDGQFLWKMMREISEQLLLPLMAEAYAYKSPKFASENEIRLIRFFPHGCHALGQSKHNDRLRIVEKIAPQHQIELLTEHKVADIC